MIANHDAMPGSLHPMVLAHFQRLTNNRKIVADFSCTSRLRMAECSHENEIGTVQQERQRGGIHGHWPHGQRMLQRESTVLESLDRRIRPRHPQFWNAPRSGCLRPQFGGCCENRRTEVVVSMKSEISKYLASIGARGGKAGTGKAKARTKAQARAAAKARWDKARALRQNDRNSATAGRKRSACN